MSFHWQQLLVGFAAGLAVGCFAVGMISSLVAWFDKPREKS